MEDPSYYAVIPANVRYDQRLSASEKLMYGEITALTQKEGYCWASNDYFAGLYGVVPTTASAWVKHLAELGYIRVQIDNADMKRRRRIWITPSASGKSEAAGSEKPEATASGKPEGNNPREINTREKEKEPSLRPVVDDYFALHLERTGSKPLWGAAEGALLKRLGASFPADEIRRRLALYYRAEFWFTKGGARSFRQFFSHFDELAGQGPAKPSQDGFIPDERLRVRNNKALESLLGASREGGR